MKFRLGEREGGTVRLEVSVAAYRGALEESTRERVPLDWAATQNNLGHALGILGEREGSRARLEEAVAAYRAALDVFADEGSPQSRAAAESNLALALIRLDERPTRP